MKKNKVFSAIASVGIVASVIGIFMSILKFKKPEFADSSMYKDWFPKEFNTDDSKDISNS